MTATSLGYAKRRVKGARAEEQMREESTCLRQAGPPAEVGRRKELQGLKPGAVLRALCRA